MASVMPMGVSATMSYRRRMTTSAPKEPAVAALAKMPEMESAQSQPPAFYPGFGAQPPLVMRPLMMIDPSSYHHLRRWALRVAP